MGVGMVEGRSEGYFPVELEQVSVHGANYADLLSEVGPVSIWVANLLAGRMRK